MTDRRRLAGVASAILFFGLSATAAIATCPTFHQLREGDTARAADVMDNFNYILNCPNFTGSVGIGTANPNGPLDVVRPVGSSASAFFEGNSSVTGAPKIVFRDLNGGNTDATLSFDKNNGFSIMGGNVGVGAATPNAKFEIQTSAIDSLWLSTGPNAVDYRLTAGASASGYAYIFGSRRDGAAAAPLLLGGYPGVTSYGNVGIGTTTPAYSLDVSGTIRASNFIPPSDRRLKKDIQPLSLNAMAKIDQLRPVTFHWIAPKDDGMNGVQIGLIAQDVESILPTTVTTANDKLKTKAIKYNELTVVLIKAVQEQQKEIAHLRARLDRLEREKYAHARREHFAQAH